MKNSSESDYPLKQCHISVGRDPSKHRSENLKLSYLVVSKMKKRYVCFVGLVTLVNSGF